MSSLVLRTAARGLLPLLVLFSVFLLIRGHHAPGGGFSGGLVAAGALTLYSFAFDSRSVLIAIRVHPLLIAGAGLTLAGASGALGAVLGRPYLTAVWGYLPLPGGAVELGTPLVFDAGVYLAVIGATLTMLLALHQEQTRNEGPRYTRRGAARRRAGE
ncbi:MAG: MnhB domain-containing protein [Armatimonadota bacterium]